jgi:hypothetical protein
LSTAKRRVLTMGRERTADDFNFGDLAAPPALHSRARYWRPARVASQWRLPAIGVLRPHWQTAALLVTARDLASGALLKSVTVKVREKGT